MLHPINPTGHGDSSSFLGSPRAGGCRNPAPTRFVPAFVTCLIVKSLIRWWLCSFRLQCKETQSLW